MSDFEFSRRGFAELLVMKPTPDPPSELLWAIVMLPEIQLVR